ncbi:Mitochondrial Carrier (MC) Family [Thraustotheca clavata]|uniref:Mitochondrial Carrier (MC) Family n=1 Tax=Thraustotheca clavata TaxID=74557 RepID=A0A1V9ZD23_9STRA|nr:Mitochondrial Carrier (MC) Family [Thraustotheca clavata]
MQQEAVDASLVSLQRPHANAYTTFLANMISGSVAGAVTDSILLPFDTINLRIKIQSAETPKYTGIWNAWKTIVREEGVRGLFGGLGTTLMMAPINTGIYYAAYEVGKSCLVPIFPKEQEPVAHFIAGCFSEFCSSITNIPSEVIKSRMQMGKNPRLATGDLTKQTTNYNGTFHAVSSIIRFEDQSPSTTETIAIGAVAGAGAAFITNPLDVVTLRLMVQGENQLYYGIRHCLQESIAKDGLSLLWKGSIIRMMSTVPNTGISFGTRRLEHTSSIIKMQQSQDSRSSSWQLPIASAQLTLLKNLVSGSVAGAVTDSVLLPFDTVNLRIKVQCTSTPKYSGILHAWQTIIKEEGVRGFFGGLSTTLLMAPINTGIYYAAYEVGKSTLTSVIPKEQESIAYFSAGAFSELCSSLTNVPTEVMKARMQLGQNPKNATGGWSKYTSNYRGTHHAASSIIRKEGISGLYSGYWSCLAVDASYAGFCFVFYEALKKRFRNTMDRSPSGAETVVIGALSGAGAAILTNPLDIVTLRLMTQGTHKIYRGVFHCLQRSIAEEGVRLLWKGSATRMMSTIPSTGISFGVYETVKDLLYDDHE